MEKEIKHAGIKLIATDVDGTLVKDSSREVSQEVIGTIQQLVDKGYYFMIASGRQYGSIRKMFAPVNRNLLFIAENGAHIIKDGQNYAVTKMKREDVTAIMAQLRGFYPEGVSCCGINGSWLLPESKDADFIHLIRDAYRNDVTLTDDILAHDVDIVKLAIYKKGSIREIGEKILVPAWKDKVKSLHGGRRMGGLYGCFGG